MRLVVGLGNPGSQYELTRHNVGFLFLDEIANTAGSSINQSKFGGLTAKVTWHGHDLLLLKPQTFMNLSGTSVLEAIQFYKLSPSDVIVVFDDLDQPAGAVRLRTGGGHGGHNGVRDILAKWGQDGFHRLKIGIGKPEHKTAVVGHVLGKFSDSEFNEIKAQTFKVAEERLLDILKRKK
ncbi:MAG: aminoacyl-tRNA hydrolase [Proteobacteria bacterium]|nr:aminoacyl-tRNA hydrolase [Pseudomonadota bacterium]